MSREIKEQQFKRKNMKLQKKLERAKRMAGKDLCSCNEKLCDGVCRQSHTDDNNKINCFALYRIDLSEFKQTRGPKRNKPKIEGKQDRKKIRDNFLKKNHTTREKN